MKRKHPMQKIVLTESGVVRFTENQIVSRLVEAYPGGLNAIRREFYNNVDDYEQLTMLIGYSVSGFGDLSTSRARTVAAADRVAARVYAAARPTAPDGKGDAE